MCKLLLKDDVFPLDDKPVEDEDGEEDEEDEVHDDGARLLRTYHRHVKTFSLNSRNLPAIIIIAACTSYLNISDYK